MIEKKVFDRQKKELLLKQYSKVVSINSTKARELIKKLDYKKDACLLERIALTYFDESLFEENGVQRAYFNMHKLRLAEKYIIQAYTINEDCIEVLYTLGKIRNAYKQTDLAIYCYKRIIEIGKNKMPQSNICTDSSLLKVFVNDSMFQLYRLYFDKNEFELSRKYLLGYKRGIKKGIDTIYKPIEKFLMT